MRHVPALVGRELSAYFLSPMAYLVLLAFQAIAWLNFWDLVEQLSRPQRGLSTLADPMVTYISGSPAFWIATLVVVPALTMRLIAEEKRSGTLEALLTAPVTEAEVVVAKWLAGVAMYLVLLLPFAVYLPFLYYQAGYHFDVGPLVALAIGLTTAGMMFVAIGVFFSAGSRSQLVAAVGTFAALFLLVLLTSMGYSYAEARRAPWADLVRFTAVLHQVYQFGTGQLDIRYLLLHLSATIFMLDLAVKVLRSRETR